MKIEEEPTSTRGRFLLLGVPIAAFVTLGLAGCPELLSLLDTAPTAVFTVAPSTNVAPGTEVTLNASGSKDPQSYSLGYSWSLTDPNGSTAALSATDGVSVTFTPDIPGQYKISLHVTASSASAMSASTSKTVTAAGSAVVKPPADLTATASATVVSVGLTWAASPATDATYNVYRGTSPEGESPTPIGTSSSTSYTDNDQSLAGGTTYYYKVTAVANGAESAASNEVSTTTATTGPIGVTLQ